MHVGFAVWSSREAGPQGDGAGGVAEPGVHELDRGAGCAAEIFWPAVREEPPDCDDKASYAVVCGAKEYDAGERHSQPFDACWKMLSHNEKGGSSSSRRRQVVL